jgi:NTP pyrophosphatase (non-canonical NTP hydrolase)
MVSKAEQQPVFVSSSLKLSKEHNSTVSAGGRMHIHEFQAMMKRLYFHRDAERGVKGTYDWLVDELGELGEALEGKDQEAVEEEFADVIAWLASLANVTGIDLERAATNKYRDRCPKCEKAPCQCTF